MNIGYFWRNETIAPWFWGYFFQGAVILGLAPIMLPIIVAGLASTPTEGSFHAGLVVAAFYLGQFPAPWIGQLAERTGRLSLIYTLSYVCIGVGCLAFPFLPTLIGWIILAFLQGLGAGASNTLTAMYIFEYRPKAVWEKGIGWLQTVYGTGQAIGLLAVALMQAHPYYAMVLCGVLMIPGIYIGRIDLPKDPKPAEVPALAINKSSQHRAFPHQHHRLGIHPISAIWHYQMSLGNQLSALSTVVKSFFGLYMLSWFFSMIGLWTVMNLLPLFFQTNYGVSPALSSLYYGIYAVIGIFFYAPSGNWSHQFGSQRVLFVGLVMLVSALLLLYGICFIPSLKAKYILAPIAFALIPIGWSPLIVAGTSLAGEITNVGQGKGLGLFNANTAVSSVISALIAGKIAASYGYTAVAMTAAIAGSIGLCLFLPLLKLVRE